MDYEQLKAFTDLEQSKVLAEILPLESADMIWILANPDLPMIKAIAYEDSEKSKYYEVLPAWSLAALLNVIPKEIFNGKYVINITEGKYNKWIITYDSGYSNSFYGLIASDNNLVDACVYIIERAHKLNLL